jgi:hypothetical protein
MDPGVAGPARAQARSALDFSAGIDHSIGGKGVGSHVDLAEQDLGWAESVSGSGQGLDPGPGDNFDPGMDPSGFGTGEGFDPGPGDDFDPGMDPSGFGTGESEDEGPGSGGMGATDEEDAADSTAGDGDGDSDSGDSVICNELYRMGLMPVHIWAADQAFAKDVPAEIVAGYHFWAKPAVRWMRRSRLAVWLAVHIALPWARHMAFRMGATDHDCRAGRIIMVVGWPICRAIGRIVLRARPTRAARSTAH